MPEGDSLHRAAQRLQVLVGERVEVETPASARRGEGAGRAARRPAARAGGGGGEEPPAPLRGRSRPAQPPAHEGPLARRAAGSRTGREAVARTAGRRARGRPLERRRARARWALAGAPRLGRDILGEPPDFETMLARLRAEPEREVGDALLDQRLVAGIGNIWKAEALWEARVSPWRRLEEVDDSELRAVLEAAHTLMRRSVEGPRPAAARLPARGPHLSPLRRQHPVGAAGRNARTAYWCPGCQVGGNAPPS